MVCWGKPDEVRSEREHIIQSLKNVKLESRINPLGKQIRKLTRYFANDADLMRKENEFVSIIICTHGIPTDECGKSGRHILKEFKDSVEELSHMPVKIIFRLATDCEKVFDFFTNLDAKFKYHVDVLDDFWGEVRFPDNVKTR